jgi:PAS domain S-box-containing protein
MVFCKNKGIEFLESAGKKDSSICRTLLEAVEEVSDGILITDKDLLIRYVNPAFEKISGLSAKEVIGKKADMIWRDHNENESQDNVLYALNREESWKGRMVGKRKDGDLYEAENIVSIVRDSSENVVGYVNVCRDVTHEVELEKQLIQAQRMQAIGTLAGGIAHDFNNILSAIMGYTEICMLQASEDSEISRRLGRVMYACQRARELVKQILTFSRQQEQAQGRVQIHLIVKEALKLLRASLPSTIEIQREIRTDSSYILADPTQIHQVLMNLCTNAAHAMGKNGGILRVALEDVFLDSEEVKKLKGLPPGHYVRLKVSDSGHGMTPEIMDRIFDPFFTTKKPDEGTGMGLAMVQNIVRNHGGRVFVESQPGKGSVFEVYFPRSTGEPILEKKSISHLPRGKERILLVDDEEDIVIMAEEMLESLGYTVKSTVSSPEALKWFDQAPDQFDLIITDQTMPMLTGSELADRVLNIRLDMTVILCTGFSDTVLPDVSGFPNIKAVIIKPFIIQEIALTVRKVLDS